MRLPAPRTEGETTLGATTKTAIRPDGAGLVIPRLLASWHSWPRTFPRCSSQRCPGRARYCERDEELERIVTINPERAR
jgi:hypothetical protein